MLCAAPVFTLLGSVEEHCPQLGRDAARLGCHLGGLLPPLPAVAAAGGGGNSRVAAGRPPEGGMSGGGAVRFSTPRLLPCLSRVALRVGPDRPPSSTGVCSLEGTHPCRLRPAGARKRTHAPVALFLFCPLCVVVCFSHFFPFIWLLLAGPSPPPYFYVSLASNPAVGSWEGWKEGRKPRVEEIGEQRRLRRREGRGACRHASQRPWPAPQPRGQRRWRRRTRL